jgi:hypothetical protein
LLKTLSRTAQGFRILLCFTILSFGFSESILSQKITISEELLLKNDYAYTILGWVEKDLLLFRDKGHAFYVQAFDEELHLKWEREIILGESRADIIGIVAQDDRFHLIYGMRERGDYFVRHCAFSHDVNLLDTSTIAFFQNVFIVPRFLMEESEDKSKVVLVKEDNEGVQLYSYDFVSLGVLWVKSITFTARKLFLDFRPLVVTNDGDFYLPMKSQNTQQKIQFLHIFSSAPSVNQIIYDTIRLGDVQAFDIFAVYDHIQQCLVITGLVGERNTARAKGFYFIRYKKGELNQLNLLAFDESLLSEINGRDVSVSRGLSDFTVQKVALRQDGGVVIIAELIKEFSRRSSLPMARDNGAYARDGWVDYYFEDMILFAVNPDGSPHWKEVLRKRQYSQDDGAMYSSFLLFKTPERLRFLFNDEIKQENTVGGYEVTGNGYIERKTVFNTDYQRLKLRFRDGVQVSNSECIIPSERSNRLNLVRIVFNES